MQEADFMKIKQYDTYTYYSVLKGCENYICSYKCLITLKYKDIAKHVYLRIQHEAWKQCCMSGGRPDANLFPQ